MSIDVSNISADLHCHSYYSDGKHSPRELTRRAREAGLSHLAITDHDCIAALAEVSSSDELTLVPGVEISCAWGERELHVLGLAVATGHAGLTALLAQQQQRRRERAAAMDARLQALGITGLGDYLAELPCQAVTRTHVADFLVAHGHSKNHQKAFKQFLGKRGRAYEPGHWSKLEETVATIHASGGIAVLAHPGRYRLGKRQLANLLTEFRECGGEAMETSYGNIDPLEQRKLRELADEHELYQSQGSDFHSAEAHWTSIGKFPPLHPGIKNAIWHHPRWHY